MRRLVIDFFARCLALALALMCVACRGAADESLLTVSLLADGETQTVSLQSAITVAELLASRQIVLGERDRVSHPQSLQVADGMRVTVRRVREEVICERQTIPFERKRIAYEGIAPDEAVLRQRGQPGEREACFRALLEDEVETGRELAGQPTVITAPVDEIVVVGPSETVAPLDIPGRLSYINNGVAWTMRGNTRSKAPLTYTEGLDSLVFEPSPGGTHLLYTARSQSDASFFNELWLLPFAAGARPVKLAPVDVLDASWRPQRANVIAYATGERGQGSAPWKALNNLWLMTIDLDRGQTLAIKELVGERSGGRYGWRGGVWVWAPSGERLAWSSADGIGLADLASGRLTPLHQFAPFDSAGSFVWLPQLSWSRDSSLLVATVHGAPLAGESRETSPVFDVVALGVDTRFAGLLRYMAGMWATPTFSPLIEPGDGDSATGYLAWLQARDPYASRHSDYDLTLADRDGSNQRRLFPDVDRPGIQQSDFGLRLVELAWSPDARMIAFVYLGDLWLADINSGASHRLTFDSGASSPVWTW